MDARTYDTPSQAAPASEPFAALPDRPVPVAVLDDRVDCRPLAPRSVALRITVQEQLDNPLLGLLRAAA